MSFAAGSKLLLTTFLLALLAPAIVQADASTGPTPYPDPKVDKDWPGKGPIRWFDWLPKYRQTYWEQRAKADGSIVFVGDSLTQNWGDIAKAFPKLKVANRGIGGDTSRGILFRYKEDVLDIHPKAIVILCGTNDLTAYGAPADAISNIADMLAQTEKLDPVPPVILCTTPPSANPKAPTKPGARQALNEGITKLAAAHKNVTLLDLYTICANADGSPKPECFNSDFLHFAAPGYVQWAKVLQPIFDKLKLK